VAVQLDNRVPAGDVLRVTCIYDSSQRERTTFVGCANVCAVYILVSNRLAVSYCRWQHTNEMCNFYVMYAVDLINPTFECLEIDELGEDEDSSEDSDASNNSDEDHSNDSDWNTHSDEDQSNDNDSGPKMKPSSVLVGSCYLCS
jgi:hypothetical protein